MSLSPTRLFLIAIGHPATPKETEQMAASLLRAHHRRNDPATSNAAARAISPKLTRARQSVLNIMRLMRGAWTDVDLIAEYRRSAEVFGYPTLTDSSIRTRRDELARLGHAVLHDTIKLGKRPMRRWRTVEAPSCAQRQGEGGG